MKNLSRILALALAAASPAALMSGQALAQTCACPIASDEPGVSTVRIVSDETPPPLPEYEQPPLPAPGYVWTPGYWNWNNDEYYWVPGVWIQPPHPGLLWTPGYWGFAAGAYLFHRGYWGPHVGFYGGVPYGHGYYGSGFEGGRWEGDHFFYNRTVNNFGSVHIENVYEHPAPRVVERVSFNGGAEGLKAKPTAEELEAAKETHVPPTVAQARHVRAASRNESAFLSSNHGKPPIAATQKPGEFKGAAVSRATAAGGPITTRPGEDQTPDVKATPREETAAPGAEKREPKGEKPDLKGEANPEPKIDKREPKLEARPESKAEKPEPKEQARPEPKAEKHEPKVEKREPKPEARPEPKAEPRAEPKPEARPAPKPEAKPEPKAEKPRPEPRREEDAHHGPGCHPGAPNCPK